MLCINTLEQIIFIKYIIIGDINRFILKSALFNNVLLKRMSYWHAINEWRFQPAALHEYQLWQVLCSVSSFSLFVSLTLTEGGEVYQKLGNYNYTDRCQGQNSGTPKQWHTQ